MRIPPGVVPIPPGPGQESVWDYPRPPRLERTARHLRVVFAGEVVAETRRGLRLLETAGAPVYYFPPTDVRRDLLQATARRSLCEWKGQARYFDVVVGDRVVPAGAWAYGQPAPAYAALRDHLAFYPRPMDECTVDGERARPQPGAFYGGWVTSDVVGPIKGDAGTDGW